MTLQGWDAIIAVIIQTAQAFLLWKHSTDLYTWTKTKSFIIPHQIMKEFVSLFFLNWVLHQTGNAHVRIIGLEFIVCCVVRWSQLCSGCETQMAQLQSKQVEPSFWRHGSFETGHAIVWIDPGSWIRGFFFLPLTDLFFFFFCCLTFLHNYLHL